MISDEQVNCKRIVEPVTIRDQVTDIVRQMILSGELQGDEAISERSISKILNVSTTPVKEAFRMLEAERLIYIKPRRGTYVSKLSKDFMEQLVFMRGAMDGVAAYYATMYIQPGEIAELETIIGEIEQKTIREASWEEISVLNAEFHGKLRQACRNDYLIRMIESMSSIDRTIRRMAVDSNNEEPKRALREHKGLLEAVKEGNPSVSEERMVKHIRRTAIMVLEERAKKTVTETVQAN